MGDEAPPTANDSSESAYALRWRLIRLVYEVGFPVQNEAIGFTPRFIFLYTYSYLNVRLKYTQIQRIYTTGEEMFS